MQRSILFTLKVVHQPINQHCSRWSIYWKKMKLYNRVRDHELPDVLDDMAHQTGGHILMKLGVFG